MILTLILILNSALAQTYDAGVSLKIDGSPEAVLLNDDKLYVSDIGPKIDFEKDGNGSIHLYDTKGNLLKKNWITGLNAPTGMATSANQVFVADIDEVVGFDRSTLERTFELSFAAEGAQFINDLVRIDSEHLIATATELNQIYIIHLPTHSYRPISISSPLGFVNGLAYSAETGILYVASDYERALKENNGIVLAIHLAEDRVLWTKNLGSFLDGIAIDPVNQELIVSDWSQPGSGAIHHLDLNSGEPLDTFDLPVDGFADFSFDPKRRLLIAPDLLNGMIHFYKKEGR